MGTNTAELLFLEAVDELWIGLNYLNTQIYFEWSDGTPVTYTKRLPGEPTHAVSGQEDCVTMAGLYHLIFVSLSKVFFECNLATGQGMAPLFTKKVVCSKLNLKLH